MHRHSKPSKLYLLADLWYKMRQEKTKMTPTATEINDNAPPSNLGREFIFLYGNLGALRR